jgi:alkylation response protein AidB-like acyl-CoA dehydrogenase
MRRLPPRPQAEKARHGFGSTPSELFFEDVQLPASSLLGTEEGQGFYQLMKELPQERLIVAACRWR